MARDEQGHPLSDNDRGGDRSEAANNVGFGTYGKSKDSRDDLPQIVIGMAVTRDGIPVRVWCWPGNTGDQALIRQVRDDMRDWTLSRIVWVADRGFSSEANRRYLRQGDHVVAALGAGLALDRGPGPSGDGGEAGVGGEVPGGGERGCRRRRW